MFKSPECLRVGSALDRANAFLFSSLPITTGESIKQDVYAVRMLVEEQTLQGFDRKEKEHGKVRIRKKCPRAQEKCPTRRRQGERGVGARVEGRVRRNVTGLGEGRSSPKVLQR